MFMFVGVTACSDDDLTNPPAGDTTALVAVIPQGGSTDVDPAATFVMEFDDSMQDGMEMYASMHTGDVMGPEVDGIWTWSENHTHLEFNPTQDLMPGTEYTMHMGGGMMDAAGHVLDLETHGPGMGGEWATDGVMNPGGGGGHPHTGEGWQHSNGSSGMLFSFSTAPEANPTVILLSVDPSGGDTGVSPDATVTMMFDHPMQSGMEMYAALHEGDVTGPEVPGTWVWSGDHTELMFTPDQPMMAGADYTIHMGGGMTGDHGQPMDFESHGPDMGGEWATGEMMDPGGMMGGHDHMGDGWQHENESFGMVFGFMVAP
jgi:hypothetical protein